MTDDRRPTTDDRRPTPGNRSVVGGQWSVVVVGYGNTLRGDDAAGPRVAEAVGGWGLAGVEAIVAHQLAPELAERLARARRALFVDASPGALQARALPLDATGSPGALGHTGDPGVLLALAEALYGARPQAWLVAVPAASFELGAELSDVAERGVAEALALIRDLLA